MTLLPVAEQRRSKRFELKLPVQFIRIGPRRTTHFGETKNVSSGGILMADAPDGIEVGQPVEFLISLPTGRSLGEVRLRCLGKVVRYNAETKTMAATLERYEFVRTSAAGV